MKSMNLKLAVAAVLLGATALAFGAGPGGGGGGGGGGHEPPDAGGNNLSVPLIMIDGGFLLNCGAAEFSAMTEIPVDAVPVYFPETCGTNMDGAVTCSVAGDYFVQGVHKWQAPCRDDSAATTPIPVYGQWGDNLAGDANFKIGSPIRVELTLWARNPADPPVEGTDPVGYKVVKLEQDKLDRESAYGTWATEGGAGGYTAAAVAMVPLVHDGEATFSVQHADHVGTDVYAVPPGTNPTAEINATGKVVYGYNLRVAEAGDYYITFNLPSVDLTLFGCNHTGDADESCSGQETKLRMTVGTGGGGGGGGGSGGKPTKKPHPINPGKGGGRN